MSKTLPTRTKLLYGIGAFGYGSVGQTLAAFLMFFGTGILGIPGVLMGVAIAASTIWDGVTDPFIGHFSDKTKSKRFGKRHGFMLVACIAIAVINIFIWVIPESLPVPAKFFMLFGLLMIIETFNTTYSTPYQALGMDISKSYEDRTAVQGYKTVFGFMALLVPSILMMVFLGGDGGRGYIWIAVITSTLCIVCGLVAFVGTYKLRNQTESVERVLPPAESDKGLFENFFGVIKQKNVKRLIIGYAVSLSAGAFLTSLGLHIFTYTFQFSTLQIPLVMMSLIFGIIAGQPLWYWYSKKTDKVIALKTALVTVIIGMILFAFVLSLRNQVPVGALLPLVALTIFICGVGTGCLYSVPVSMFADCIEMEKKRTGIDKTAVSAAFLTFCMKISNAFVMFVVGLSLDIIGFSGAIATQSLSVQNWLGWLLVCGVITASVIAYVAYSGYSYNRNDFDE